MAVTKPTTAPEWALEDTLDTSSGQNNVAPPTSSEVRFGYGSVNDLPSRQKWNWLGRVVSLWVGWFDQQETAHGEAIADAELEIGTLKEKVALVETKSDAASAANVRQDGEIDALEARVSVVEAFTGTPVGTVVPYFGTAAQLAASSEDWLICDGTTFSGTDYPALRDHLTAAGAVDPTKLPNLSGRFVVGAGGLGSDFYDLGGTSDSVGKSGESAHVLTEEELADHKHGTYTVNLNQTVRSDSGGTQSPVKNGLNTNTTEGIYSPGVSVGKAHENRPPFFALNYIIKGR